MSTVRLRSLVVAIALLGASSVSWAASAPMAASAPRPIAAASIRLEVEGVQVASFDQLVGLTSALEPGPAPRFAVILRRPATPSLEVASWHHAALRGEDAARKDVIVTMHAADGKPVMRYALTRAFPSKIELATSDASEVLMETVTLSCAHIERLGV